MRVCPASLLVTFAVRCFPAAQKNRPPGHKWLLRLGFELVFIARIRVAELIADHWRRMA